MCCANILQFPNEKRINGRLTMKPKTIDKLISDFDKTLRIFGGVASGLRGEGSGPAVFGLRGVF